MDHPEINATRTIEAMLGVHFPMREAWAFYNAIDESEWRVGTDTYLRVGLMDGITWEVGKATPHRVHLLAGSPLAKRNVHTRWVLDLAYNEHTPEVPDVEVNGSMVHAHATLRLEVYNDQIAYAAVEAY